MVGMARPMVGMATNVELVIVAQGGQGHCARRYRTLRALSTSLPVSVVYSTFQRRPS